jgi:hypothetical protein
VLNFTCHWKLACGSQFGGVTTVAIASFIAGAVIGCGSSQAPLSIHMYNPKTHQALTCSARDPSARYDTSLLAGAVESCAKSLEARGFVREK